MFGETLALIGAVIATALSGYVVFGLRREAVGRTAEIRRLRAIAAENTRVRRTIVAIDRTVEGTALTVGVGTDIVATTHNLIASIPFGILEAIPVTRPVTKVVHTIHDQIAGGVYGMISGASRTLGNSTKRVPKKSPENPNS